MAEIRAITSKVEVRDVDGKKRFVGRAVVYGSRSEPIYGQFVEVLSPGCFDESLAKRHDIIASVDHDPQKLLGRMSSGTLRLTPGPDGIDAECDLSDTTYARDLAISIERGDIQGMSFMFDVLTDDWKRSDGIPERTVLKAELYEVSWVVFPAYPATTADVRNVSNAGRQSTIERMIAALGDPLDNYKRKLSLIEKE